MHDKHHYLDNYCSHESDADGNAWSGENLNLLEESVHQLLPHFVLLGSETFWNVTSFVSQARD